VLSAAHAHCLQALERKRDRALARVQTIFPSLSERQAQERAEAARAMVATSAAVWEAVIGTLEADYPGATLARLPGV
jgi:hypothetical protein